MTITAVCKAARELIHEITPSLMPDDPWLQAETQGPLGDEDGEDGAWRAEPGDALRVFAIYPLGDQRTIDGTANHCTRHVNNTLVIETLYRYCPRPNVPDAPSPQELAAQDAEEIAQKLVCDLTFPAAGTVNEVEPQGRFELERLGERDDNAWLQRIEILINHAIGGED